MARLVNDETWAALTIWQEARNQPRDGKRAVAEVIRNRMRLRYMSNGTVVNTVLAPDQFSGWNTKDVNRLLSAVVEADNPEVQACVQAWKDSNEPERILPLDTVHYLNPAAVAKMPDWAIEANLVATIGAHQFYRA